MTAASSWWPSWPTRSTTSSATPRPSTGRKAWTAFPNWLYLTGSPAQLAQVWHGYGIAAEIAPAGSMIAHSEIAYVIDSSGRLRQEMDFDPGPGTAATQSSFAAELTDAARQLLRQS